MVDSSPIMIHPRFSDGEVNHEFISSVSADDMNTALLPRFTFDVALGSRV